MDGIGIGIGSLGLVEYRAPYGAKKTFGRVNILTYFFTRNAPAGIYNVTDRDGIYMK